MSRLARIFFSGLLALLPLVVTIVVLGWAFSMLRDYLGPGSIFGNLLVSLGMGVGVITAAPYVAGLLALLIARRSSWGSSSSRGSAPGSSACSRA